MDIIELGTDALGGVMKDDDRFVLPIMAAIQTEDPAQIASELKKLIRNPDCPLPKQMMEASLLGLESDKVVPVSRAARRRALSGQGSARTGDWRFYTATPGSNPVRHQRHVLRGRTAYAT